MNSVIPVTSLDQFEREILSLRASVPHPTTFRGQRIGRDRGWSLFPMITREPRRRPPSLNIDQVKEVEEKFVEEFRRRMRSNPTDLIDNWDAAITGRHHRLVTRLLDWTESPQVALYFAVQGDSNNGDSFVYGTNWERRFRGDLVAITKANAPWELAVDEKPFFFLPDFISPRVYAQRSVLSVWGNPWEPFDQVIDPNAFWEFRVPRNLRGDIRTQLDWMGINEESLYPDPDGAARYLEWKCENEKWTGRGSKKP